MNLILPLLTIQTTAALVSLLGAAIVISVVVFLISSSTTYEDKKVVKEKVYKLRGRYLIGLVSVVVIALLTSLQFLPYPKFQTTPDEEVTVVGMQWTWKMAQGASDTSPLEFVGTNDITLPVNKIIQFNVTSTDVNHNFAIYNSKGDLVAQTQAMPEYHNILQYKFTEPGDYSILCLEYCGMPHAYMTGKIHIN